MTFAHPFALVLLAALPWLWWAGARARSHVTRAATTWRILTVLVFVLAAAGVRIMTPAEPLTVVAVLDRSASMPLAAQERAVARVDAITPTMRAQDRLGVVTLGADAAVERRPATSRSFNAVTTSPPDFATDLSAGLRVARSLLPDTGGRRLLLITDGQETSGDAEREALQAKAAGIPIDVVLPEERVVTAPMRVTRVVAPSDVTTREPYVVSVEVTGPVAARANVAIYRDDELVTTTAVSTAGDGTGVVTIHDNRDEPGAYVYRASVIDAGGLGDNGDVAGTVVTVSGAPRVLYVSQGTGALPPALKTAGFAVTPVLPSDVPRTLAALEPFAAIVLDDVAAEQLPEPSLMAIRDYVEQTGGGLLVLGSARTLTLNGFPSSPLEPVLPIDLRPRSGSRGTSVAMVVVFDKSGSMADTVGGVSKIEVARQAVANVADVTPPSDSIGVLAFDGRPVPVLPVTSGVTKRLLTSHLDAVAPGGPTAIAPALDLAIEWLHAGAAANATRRQILLLSDGRTSDDDARRVRQTVSAHRDVTLSVVAIGANANRALLEPLATGSGGRAYFPENVRDLPRLVAREAARSSGGGVVDERFVPRGSAHPILEGLDPGSLPPLGGYVVGVVKPPAAAIIASHLGDPILSGGRAGLGRVAVFTADLSGRWSDALRGWPRGPQLWAQTVRWLSRRGTDGELRVDVRETRDGTHLQVAAETPDGGAPDFEAVYATVRSPGEADRDLPLDPIAPGRYEARLAASRPGRMVVAVTARDRATHEEHRLVRTVYRSADREHRAVGINRPLLNRLAAITGGRVLAEADSPFAMARPHGYSDAVPAALVIGLAMFLVDLVIAPVIGRPRRWPWQRAAGHSRDRAAA